MSCAAMCSYIITLNPLGRTIGISLVCFYITMKLRRCNANFEVQCTVISLSFRLH